MLKLKSVDIASACKCKTDARTDVTAENALTWYVGSDFPTCQKRHASDATTGAYAIDTPSLNDRVEKNTCNLVTSTGLTMCSSKPARSVFSRSDGKPYPVIATKRMFAVAGVARKCLARSYPVIPGTEISEKITSGS